MIHNTTGKQVDLVGLVGGVQIEVGMRLVIALALVVHQGREHHAGLHIVAVDEVVLRGEVRVAADIQEDGAVLVVLAVDIAVQIVLAALVRGLHDGQLQRRIGAVHITHHVGVLGLHGGEVHLDALFILLDRLLRLLAVAVGAIAVGIGIAGGIVRTDEVLIDIVVDPLGVLLFLQIRNDLDGREHQHAHQDHQNGVIQGFSVLSAAAAPSAAVTAGTLDRLLLLHTGSSLGCIVHGYTPPYRWVL